MGDHPSSSDSENEVSCELQTFHRDEVRKRRHGTEQNDTNNCGIFVNVCQYSENNKYKMQGKD